MSETVLCGCVRAPADHPSGNRELEKNYKHLESILPFVYCSTPRHVKTTGLEDQSVIRDRVDRVDTRWTGIHSVLKVLRQPVLMVSATTPAVEPSLLERFIDQWDRCPERISGVFQETDDHYQQYPALYASPMLPRLRETRTKENISASRMIQPEATRTIKNVTSPR